MIVVFTLCTSPWPRFCRACCVLSIKFHWHIACVPCTSHGNVVAKSLQATRRCRQDGPCLCGKAHTMCTVQSKHMLMPRDARTQHADVMMLTKRCARIHCTLRSIWPRVCSHAPWKLTVHEEKYMQDMRRLGDILFHKCRIHGAAVKITTASDHLPYCAVLQSTWCVIYWTPLGRRSVLSCRIASALDAAVQSIVHSMNEDMYH